MLMLMFFIHFYMLVCLNIQTFYEFYLYIITVMFLSFYSGYFVFILCIHWPTMMCNVYDFNLCVFYHVLGQKWLNKRVQFSSVNKSVQPLSLLPIKGWSTLSPESSILWYDKDIYCPLLYFCLSEPYHWLPVIQNEHCIPGDRDLVAISQLGSWAHKWNLAKIMFSLILIQMKYQVIILHMSRQLSCRDMCKIVTWFDNYSLHKRYISFKRFGLWAHKPFAKWSPVLPRHNIQSNHVLNI